MSRKVSKKKALKHNWCLLNVKMTLNQIAFCPISKSPENLFGCKKKDPNGERFFLLKHSILPASRISQLKVIFRAREFIWNYFPKCFLFVQNIAKFVRKTFCCVTFASTTNLCLSYTIRANFIVAFDVRLFPFF